MASSNPTPIGCPVNPLVFAMTIDDATSPKVLRSACTSADALPPRAGVYVSWEINTIFEAIALRSSP